MGIILLASASPRRHEILKQINIEHEVLNPKLYTDPNAPDEPQQANESAVQYVRRTAMDKALAACKWFKNQENAILGGASLLDKVQGCANAYILSADTTVCLDGTILGKPDTAKDAAATLQLLSGKTHKVYTAVTVIRAADMKAYSQMSETLVSFKKLNEFEIQLYIESQEPFGKAGAYAIQGQAAAFITQMTGSYTGVVGLPAYETCELLKAAGALR